MDECQELRSGATTNGSCRWPRRSIPRRERLRSARGVGPLTSLAFVLHLEHLAADHGLEVPRETLRRWMLAAGLWSRRRKRKPHRSRRQRKAHFGELVQLDGLAS